MSIFLSILILAIALAGLSYSYYRGPFLKERLASPAPVLTSSPYRSEAPGADAHPVDCESCNYLAKRGRWQPPEIVFLSGHPVPCLMIHFQVSDIGELDKLAALSGLVRANRDRDRS